MLFPSLDVLTIWRYQMPTVNTAVCARVRASLWCSQAAQPHFRKTIQTLSKANINPKIWLKYDDNFLSCGAIMSGKLWRKTVHILPQTLGKMGHQVNHFHFQKRKSGVMFRRLPFWITLKEFLNYFNSLQSYGQNS